jgi:hypothetical protein
MHGEKFLTVSYPNGLIGALYGPYEGRASDPGILAATGMLNGQFQDLLGNDYCLYGDLAFALTLMIMTPFLRNHPNYGAIHEAFNQAMSRVRISVEWGYYMVANLFQSIDFSRYQRVFLTRPGLQYRVATIFLNLRTCLDGENRISTYFDLVPPTAEACLQGDDWS